MREINTDTEMEMLFWNEIVEPNSENEEKYQLLSRICADCYNFATHEYEKIDSIYLYQKKYSKRGINWKRYDLEKYVLNNWEYLKWGHKRKKYFEQKYAAIVIPKERKMTANNPHSPLHPRNKK